MVAGEQAFSKTEVGIIEVKTIPSAKLIRASGETDYFEENNTLFRPLFRYIQANDIPMTTPVEAEISPGAMYFYIGDAHANRALQSTDAVEVVELAERTVVSIGVRGSYSEEQYTTAKNKLEAWLKLQDTWQAAGPAKAIYWNGPFVPGFVKRAEVHIPVVQKTK